MKRNIIFMLVTLICFFILKVTNAQDPRRICGFGFECKYSEGADSVFNKPIIILEGFDVVESTSANDKFENWDSYHDLLDYGYDIITLSYDNSHIDLHENKENLKDFIVNLNANKEQGNFENIIIGESMGGIIVRMALAELEDESYDHQTGLYISFDSPHKGANITIGLQKFIDRALDIDLIQVFELLPYIEVFNFWAWMFNLGGEIQDFIDQKDLVVAAMNSTAAQQQILHHHLGNQRFNQLQFFLDSIGYPQQSRNIAIINGSNTGAVLDFSPGDKVYSSEFGECIPGVGGYRHKINVWSAFTNEPDIKVAQIRIKGTKFCFNVTEKEPRSGFGNLCYDNCPGGYIEDEENYGNQNIDAMCFVPTVHAIDLRQDIINSEGLDYFNVNEGITVQHLIDNGYTFNKALN